MKEREIELKKNLSLVITNLKKNNQSGGRNLFCRATFELTCSASQAPHIPYFSYYGSVDQLVSRRAGRTSETNLVEHLGNGARVSAGPSAAGGRQWSIGAQVERVERRRTAGDNDDQRQRQQS